ncbi:MAG: outer membrane beta-barrel protein, partial [Prevotella sp.]|nr:outer membrane beta-barrel protein [Prevotella sp.]
YLDLKQADWGWANKPYSKPLWQVHARFDGRIDKHWALYSDNYLVGSRREGFENINAGDYQVGFNTTLNLPAKFQFATDLTRYARRGSQQRELNTPDWVWNAQLTRSFLNGKLLAKLKGFDILQQLSNTRYVMNEQGRTESWHNGIPRYVMLSLSWRFNVMPKQKSE